jgi:hypothetical protein
VRIEEGYGVRVLGCVGCGVDVVEGILRVRLRAILGEQEGFLVFVGLVRGLEEESWGALAATMSLPQATVRRHVLGRFSSNMATFPMPETWLCGLYMYKDVEATSRESEPTSDQQES